MKLLVDMNLTASSRSTGLDFGALLALTHATGPSVVQTRTADITPARLAPHLAATLLRHEADLMRGALIVIDEFRAKVRILPIRRGG